MIKNIASFWTKSLNIAFRDITTFGGVIFYAFFCMGLLLLKEYNLAIKIIFGILIIFVIISVIRIFYHKERPVKQEYHNFMEKIDAYSFPSMHTSRAFFFSLTLITFFKYEILAVLFFGGLGILVSVSRIYLKKHDWWDLLGGVVLGTLMWLALMSI